MSLLKTIEDKLIEPLDVDKVLFHASFEPTVPLTQASLSRSLEFKKRAGTKSERGDRNSEHRVWLRENREITKNGLVLALQERALEFQLKVPFEHPVWAMCLFFYPPAIYYSPLGLVSRRTPTLVKLLDFATDAMVKSNILWSAKQIQSHDGSRKLVGDKLLIEIFLMRFDIEQNKMPFKATSLARKRDEEY